MLVYMLLEKSDTVYVVLRLVKKLETQLQCYIFAV
jgi:hypothetical protein